jgi:DNA-binding CsgD family transcriptional regulator
MSITADRIAKANGAGGKTRCLETGANPYLFETVSGALDCLAPGVVIVAEQGRILHANLAARHMIEAKSPILSLGGCLCALQAERTKELRLAIAAAQAGATAAGLAGIGVSLIDKTGAAATAQVLPLKQHSRAALPGAQRGAAVFVMSMHAASAPDIATVAQSYHLTPAEERLLQQLVSGASLHEAAAALGIAEATARTHRNHIFTKAGVTRRSDLLLLVGRLVPPVRCRR